MILTKNTRVAIIAVFCMVFVLNIATSRRIHAEEVTLLADKFPQLMDTPLANAEIVSLPDGIFLRGNDVTVSKKNVEDQLAQVPEENRDMLRDNFLFIAEQLFTEKLLLSSAKKELAETRDITGLEDREIFGYFFEGMTESIEISDQDIDSFYHQNQQMMGDMDLETAKPQIKNFLRQQQQQHMIEEYVIDVLQNTSIEISSYWVENHITEVMDNEIDNARINGKPSFIVFSSEATENTQPMKPVVDNLSNEYEGQADVLYIAVDKEPILATRYAIQDVPTLIFFDNVGQEIGRHTGIVDEQEIKQQINMLLVN